MIVEKEGTTRYERQMPRDRQMLGDDRRQIEWCRTDERPMPIWRWRTRYEREDDGEWMAETNTR